MARDRVRFAFTIADGPNAGLSCGGWRLWVHGDSTYLTGTSVGGIWKASLHGDIAWRYAATREHMRSDRPVLPGHDRVQWTFTPPPFVSGGRLAFAIAATRGALRREQLDTREVHIRVHDRWDQVTVAYVYMTEPSVDFRPSRLVAGPLALSNDRRVWLTAGTEGVAPIEAESIPVSVMVEPKWPEQHGVAAPGLVLRGVHLG